jgi:hypothetical protein
MSHASGRPRLATPTEMRVPAAPGVSLHVERRDGDPAALAFILVHGLASNLRLRDTTDRTMHGG